MVQSIFINSRALPLIAGSGGVCAVTILANRALSKIPYLSEGRRGMLASVAVTVLIASTCTSMGWAAIATGAVAALIILGISRAAAPVAPRVVPVAPREVPAPRAVPVAPREEPLAPRAVPRAPRAVDDTSRVRFFIFDAIEDGRADRVRQLTRFLSQLPQFQNEAQLIGLVVHLQEVILKAIHRFNRGDLLDQIFLPRIQSELLRRIPSINADVANIIEEYNGELIDEQGRLRVLRVTDGTLLNDLRNHEDARMQAFGRDGGLANTKAASSHSDFVSVAMRNTPMFRGIDFSPLYDL